MSTTAAKCVLPGHITRAATRMWSIRQEEHVMPIGTNHTYSRDTRARASASGNVQVYSVLVACVAYALDQSQHECGRIFSGRHAAIGSETRHTAAIHSRIFCKNQRLLCAWS